MHTGRCNANVFFSNVNWGAGLSHMHNSQNGSLYCKCLFFQWKLGDGPLPHGQLREHGNSQSSRAMQLRSVEVRPHRKLGKGPTRYCPSQISKLDSNKNWGAGISHTGRCIENVFFSNGNWGAGLSHVYNSKNMGTAGPREQRNSEALKYGHAADLTSKLESKKIGGRASRTWVAVLQMSFFPLQIGGRASPTCTTPRTRE